MKSRVTARLMPYIVVVLAFVAALGGCTRNRELAVTVTNETQTTDQIVIPVDNCSGAGEITSEATYDLRVNVQGAGDLGVDVGAVRAKIASSLGVQTGYTIKQTVRTPPGKRGEHRVRFVVTVSEGFVSREGSRAQATYVARAPESFAGVESLREDCGGNDTGDPAARAAVAAPKAHAWRCTVEITDRDAGAVVGSGELTFGRVADGNALEYGRLFLDTVKLSGMERNMESQAAAWGFMGERTDDVLTFVFPDYRFPDQPFMLLNVTPDQTTGTLELRGDLLFNKPQQSAVAYVSASCRAAD
ncbi:MAG: hypothetical protein KDD83_11535 [Caldilineaceae bacterium]|nr:hypothetical protein [Caldilineaceae bacterium]